MLRDGGVLAYPTEGVFGIGCLPFEAGAVDRILAIKARSWRKGLLMIAGELEQIERLIVLPQSGLRQEILASWPGPVTWVLEARPPIPKWISGGTDTVAVRLTGHPVARALCVRAGSPLVSTSANRAGHPPLTRAIQVRRALGSGFDYLVPGALGNALGPSIIRDGRSGRTLRA